MISLYINAKPRMLNTEQESSTTSCALECFMPTSFHHDVSTCREALNVSNATLCKDLLSSIAVDLNHIFICQICQIVQFRTRECHGTHAMRAKIYELRC